MENDPVVQPLSVQHRKRTFWALLIIFIVLLPFLFLYATGYRFEFGEEANLISTGGIYIAVERTGAEIYIDDELVRETRTFRRAFYAQSLSPGTHRVHVQKLDHHTWVKELPVYPHLVTEAQAFNLPLIPRVRIISPWQSATGTPIVSAFTLRASTTNNFIATSTKRTTTFTRNTEYESLLRLFSTTTATSSESLVNARITDQIDLRIPRATLATSSPEVATTTKEWQGVLLYEDKEDVYARWVGSRESMPYYYCAEDFPAYVPQSTTTPREGLVPKDQEALTGETVELIHPVQTIPEDVVCEPVIKIDRRSQSVKSFDFFNGSTDFVVLVLEDGIYVVEVDSRAWQNVQPVLMGEQLDMRVENGLIYVYDDELIYQVILE
jgi:hypothetical protein